MPKRVGIYEIEKTLGEGTFGKVKKAKNTQTDEYVAIKVLDKEKIQKQNMGGQVKREISIMKLIKHPNIVQLHEVLASKTKIFIVLELVSGGEVFDKIVQKSKLDETSARVYFQQLCVGTEYCHRQGVCHRDLKPENLLLDNLGNLKISDFGLSALFDQGEGKQNLLHTTCGTPNYVAPEVIADKGYDGARADTWSIGVILYVFLAGFLPFDEQTLAALFRKIERADFQYPPWFTDDVKDLIGKILIANPLERWTIRQIFSHPWWRKDGPHKDIADSLQPEQDQAGVAQGLLQGSMATQAPGQAHSMDTDGRPAELQNSTFEQAASVQVPSQPPVQPQLQSQMSFANDNHHPGSNQRDHSQIQAGSNHAHQGGTPQLPMHMNNGQNGLGVHQSSSSVPAGFQPTIPVIRRHSETDSGAQPMQTEAPPGGYAQGVNDQGTDVAMPVLGVVAEKTNAFEIIDLATGGPLSSIVMSERKKFLYLSGFPITQVISVFVQKFKSMSGFLSQETYKGGYKLKSEFDLGRGRVKIKVAVKVAHENPLLCMVVMKRAGGDVLSFQKISDEVELLREYLQTATVSQ